MIEHAIKYEHPDSEILNLSHNETTYWIEHLYEGSKDPLFIWGTIGIGKTSLISKAAKDLNIEFISVSLSTKTSSDFIGLPSIHNKRTVYNLPWFFPTEETKGKGGIIFFDEINRVSDKNVLNSLLSLVLDRKLDNYVLPDNWYIIVAGNRNTDDRNVYEMGTALYSRFLHINLMPSTEEWIEWSKSPVAGSKEGESILIPDILKFIAFSEKYFHRLVPDRNAPVWANPRSWTKVNNIYTHIVDKFGKAKGEEELYNILVMGVGREAADEFFQFKKLDKYFSIDDIMNVYKDPINAKLPPVDENGNYIPDIIYAFFCKLAYDRERIKITKEEYANLFKYAIRLGNFEYCMALLKFINYVHPYTKTLEYAAYLTYEGPENMNDVFMAKYNKDFERVVNILNDMSTK